MGEADGGEELGVKGKKKRGGGKQGLSVLGSNASLDCWIKCRW